MVVLGRVKAFCGGLEHLRYNVDLEFITTATRYTVTRNSNLLVFAPRNLRFYNECLQDTSVVVPTEFAGKYLVGAWVCRSVATYYRRLDATGFRNHNWVIGTLVPTIIGSVPECGAVFFQKKSYP